MQEFLAHDLAPARRAELYCWAASFAAYSDPAATLRYGEALVGLGRELGDDMAVARGLAQVGCVQQFSDPVAALGTLAEALATARAVGDGISVVDCLCFSAVRARISAASAMLSAAPRRHWRQPSASTTRGVPVSPWRCWLGPRANWASSTEPPPPPMP